MRSNGRQVRKILCALAVFTLAFSSLTWGAPDDNSSNAESANSDVVKRIQKSADVLNEIMGTPDKGIPDNVFADANCVAVIPSMVKFAIGFGGSHGKGIATCRTSATGWSAPVPITITGGSWGLQLGGQAVDLVLLAMNQKGMDALLSDKFKIGGDASASAGPVGRHAEADTDWKMKSELLSYSRSRGLFAGIDLSGSVVSQDKDETRLLYGRMIPAKEILTGKVKAPAGSANFLATIKKYSTITNEKKETGSNTTPNSSANQPAMASR